MVAVAGHGCCLPASTVFPRADLGRADFPRDLPRDRLLPLPADRERLLQRLLQRLIHQLRQLSNGQGVRLQAAEGGVELPQRPHHQPLVVRKDEHALRPKEVERLHHRPLPLELAGGGKATRQAVAGRAELRRRPGAGRRRPPGLLQQLHHLLAAAAATTADGADRENLEAPRVRVVLHPLHLGQPTLVLQPVERLGGATVHQVDALLTGEPGEDLHAVLPGRGRQQRVEAVADPRAEEEGHPLAVLVVAAAKVLEAADHRPLGEVLLKEAAAGQHGPLLEERLMASAADGHLVRRQVHRLRR
ncbi:hypothetical protein TYRP_020606 [Tyrophagus putrescentiae]|nr:hypothetical protein TYRP_020606 [Tyrophagus putrescentiae]